jgi:hypothetical protein
LRGARQDRGVGMLRIDALHVRPHGGSTHPFGGGLTIAQPPCRARVQAEGQQ